MSLRDYDKFTPAERRRRAEGGPVELTVDDINAGLVERNRILLGGCNCRMCLAARGARERRLCEKLAAPADGFEVKLHSPSPKALVDWEAVVAGLAVEELTRRRLEGGSDHRGGVGESRQDNSVDAGVSGRTINVLPPHAREGNHEGT